MKSIFAAASIAGLSVAFAAAAFGKPPTKPAPVTAAPPTYYASSGEMVGPMIDNGIVMVRVDGLTAAVFLNFVDINRRGAGATWITYATYYDQSACAGTAYMNQSYSAPGLTAFAQAERGLDGKLYLYFAPAAGLRTVTTYSRSVNGVCTEEANPLLHDVYPVTSRIDISAYALPLIIK